MKQIIVLISILVVLTTVIVAVNPKMHKQMQFTVTDFGLNNVKVENKKQNVNLQNYNSTKQAQTVNVQQVQTTTNVQPVRVEQKPIAQKQTAKVTPVNNTKNVTTHVTPIQTKTVSKPVTTTNKNVKTEQPVKVTQQKVTPVQKPVQTTQAPTTQTVVKPQPKPVQTQTQTAAQKAAQETIAWNTWRANVHNNIVSRVNLPIVPSGTVFKYSFTVTKDGTISGVKTSSTTPQYTAYAIQYIAPVIRNSNHASFLRFPTGTERQSVTVEYKFATTNGAGTRASANNFNDTEVIRR
ncbi:MAG: hypothetical protein MJ231_01445 [bacterium]|nr:hypothetical protein [bacterium]